MAGEEEMNSRLKDITYEVTIEPGRPLQTKSSKVYTGEITFSEFARFRTLKYRDPKENGVEILDPRKNNISRGYRYFLHISQGNYIFRLEDIEERRVILSRMHEEYILQIFAQCEQAITIAGQGIRLAGVFDENPGARISFPLEKTLELEYLIFGKSSGDEQ